MSATGNTCWAAGTSPCAGPITEEHYASYGLFQDPVAHIQAGPLAKNGPREIPIKRLVTNSLCDGHNNALSELDLAGIDFQNALRRIWELHDVRAPLAGRRGWKPVRLIVDGPRLERWLLKFAFSAAPVFRQQLDGWSPTAVEASLAIGTRQFGPGAGLYYVGVPSDTMTNEERITFSYGIRLGSTAPIAFTLALRGGYRLAVVWESPRSANDQLAFFGSDSRPLSEMLHRPKRFEFKAGARDLALSVDFDWSGRWSATRYPDVAGLRSRYPAPPR